MATSGDLATLVCEAMAVPYEVANNHLRNLREAGLLDPTGRGRSARPVTTRDAAMLMVACLASTMLKNSAATVGAAYGLQCTSLARSDGRKGGPRLLFRFYEEDPLLRLRRGHALSDGFAAIVERLFRGKLFRPPEHADMDGSAAPPYDPAKEYFVLRFIARFANGDFALVRAEINYGVRGLYALTAAYGERVEDDAKLWTRQAARNPIRTNALGLASLEGVILPLRGDDV